MRNKMRWKWETIWDKIEIRWNENEEQDEMKMRNNLRLRSDENVKYDDMKKINKRDEDEKYNKISIIIKCKQCCDVSILHRVTLCFTLSSCINLNP